MLTIPSFFFFYLASFTLEGKNPSVIYLLETGQDPNSEGKQILW